MSAEWEEVPRQAEASRDMPAAPEEEEASADAVCESEVPERPKRLSRMYGLEPSAASVCESENLPDLEEFEIETTKIDPSESVGISVLRNRRRLVAGTVNSAGLIARWNAEHPEKLVKYGSVVVAVNGVSDNTEAMMQECKTCTAVKLKVQRRRHYTVIVPDKKERLGIEFCPKTMKVLTITTSRELCDRVSLASWNLTCPDGCEILPDDVLVKVNGQGGTPEELLQLIRLTEGELRMVFVRS